MWLTPEQHERLKQEYLAQQYYIRYGKRHGRADVAARIPRIRDVITKQQLLDAWEKHKKSSEVAKALGISTWSVTNLMKLYDLRAKPGRSKFVNPFKTTVLSKCGAYLFMNPHMHLEALEQAEFHGTGIGAKTWDQFFQYRRKAIVKFLLQYPTFKGKHLLFRDEQRKLVPMDRIDALVLGMNLYGSVVYLDYSIGESLGRISVPIDAYLEKLGLREETIDLCNCHTVDGVHFRMDPDLAEELYTRLDFSLDLK